MSAITVPEFEFVSALAFQHAAIVLDRGKEYLVEARLAPLAQREGFDSLAALIAALRNENFSSQLQAKAVEALTTNETFFFRDFHPFEAMRRTVLPDLISKRHESRTLTIWCAACSTGQEPFSIAMLIREHFPQLASWKIDIIASDYSPTVLQQAESGRYNQFEVNRGLPAIYLVKYFTQEGTDWVIKPDIRSMIRFRTLNLVKPWPILPSCDIVFIRNVMIYFDLETKKSILQKLRRCLRAEGSLFLGSCETTLNVDPHWAAVPHGSTTVYRPVGDSPK